MKILQKSFSLAGACALVLAAGISQAASITWSSHDTVVDPSDNAAWSNSANWVGGVAPVANDDLVFPAPVANGTRTTNNDLPANTQINGISLPANAYVLNGNAINLGGNVSFTAGGANVATIGLSSALLQDTTYTVSANTSNGRLQVDGNISGSFGITKAGDGRLRFTTTAKTYTGNTIVTGGLLDMSTTNDLMPFGAGKGDLYLGVGSQLFLNNVTLQINGLNDYAGGAGVVNKGGSNPGILTLGNGDANGSFSGAMTFTGGGASTVNKVGAGTQTLSGAVSVTGAGSVTGGRLNINGTWNQGMNVNSTGTLGGTGTISGAVNIGNAATAGTLSPGTSAGTLSIANAVVFSANGILAADINGSDNTIGTGINDLVTSVSNLTLDGTLNIIELVPGFIATAANGTLWRLINYTGTLTDNTMAIGAAPVLPPGSFLSIDTSTAGQVNLKLTSIPEPGSIVLMLVGALVMFARSRRA